MTIPERGDSKGTKGRRDMMIMAMAITSFSLIMVGTVVLCLAANVHQHSPLNVRASFSHILSRWRLPSSFPPLISDLARKKLLCSTTSYPDLCMQTLNESSPSSNSIDLVSLAVRYALQRLNFVYDLSYRLANQQGGDSMETAALHDCTELLADSMDQLTLCLFSLSSLPNSTSNASMQDMPFQDVRVHLSSSISFQTTCFDGCGTYSPNIRSKLLLAEQDILSNLIANCLGLVNSLCNSTEQSGVDSWHGRRHAVDATTNEKEDQHLVFSHQSGYPDWLSGKDRHHLQAPPSSVSRNAVVAQDGSGQYKTLQEAVNKIPTDYSGRYVIYIKQGVYRENVTIARKYKNIMLLGDGINRTIITGNRNVALQNYTTYRSATVAVSSPGFIAKGITFQNTAGPQGHQAVALRVNGDLSAFVSCSFEGYQDTLYALAGRQFYRTCDIYGTVDYIFGNAIAIFQKCNLYARLPIIGQQITYTAQSRTVIDDPSGYSFQNCSLLPTVELANSSFSVAAYLGRPWKQYSRTVYLLSYMDNIINAAGWLAWNSSNPYINTLYYGEYKNIGPGSNISQRVTWPGVHSNMSFHDASVFSPNKFISARKWLHDDGITYDELS